MDKSLTRAASELVVGLDERQLSLQARGLVSTAFLDCLGCTVAGADSDDAQVVRGWVESLGGTPEATLVAAGGASAPASLAALVNATAAHALDLDDFSSTMMHPSVCLVPALLAVGERTGASGREVLLAYAAGFELFARLCRTMNPEHYARGWHSTSTVGTPAVAAAVARLLKLDRAGVETAIAIAASSSAGLRQNFGSMVKPYHAANAAFHGIAAAELAARGFTAGADILDGPRGFIAVFAGEEVANAVDPALFTLDGELELDRGGIAFKRYACCGAIHAALDAALALRERHGLSAGDIASAHCAVNRWAPEILIHHSATTSAQARFCVEYSLAAALTDGDAGVLQYEEERIADEGVQDLARRIAVTVDEELAVGYSTFPARVTIELRSGETLTSTVEVARGNPSDPFSEAELDQKFRSCASLQLGQADVEAALTQARGLAELEDVSLLARTVGGSRTLDPVA